MVSAVPRPSESISLRVCAASAFPAVEANHDSSIRTRQKQRNGGHVSFFVLGMNLVARVCGQRIFGSQDYRRFVLRTKRKPQNATHVTVSALRKPLEAVSLRASAFPAVEISLDSSIRTHQRQPNAGHALFSAIGMNLAARVCGQRIPGSRDSSRLVIRTRRNRQTLRR